MLCTAIFQTKCTLYISPADATASDIGTSTTEVSWVVPFIPEQIEFTVYYGTNEDSLDGASDTVTSSADTSLTDQEYSVTLTGLRLGVSYYFKVVGTYSDFTVESDVGEFTTNELGKLHILLFLVVSVHI